MKTITNDELAGVIPFFFYRTHNKAFVFASHYKSAKSANRAAFDACSITGLTTRVIPRIHKRKVKSLLDSISQEGRAHDHPA